MYCPGEYREKCYTGELKGYYIDETKTFHIFDTAAAGRKDVKLLGYIMGDGVEESAGEGALLVCRWQGGELEAKIRGRENPVTVEFYSLRKEIFSRNQGILESDQMSDKQAVLLGVGSGGSFVALELAKAGIGSLILCDDDRLAYHNICRHQCGIRDVGKWKVDAMAERIADINPFCKVVVFRNQIQHVDPEAFGRALWSKSVLLCCADNRHAGYVCNELAEQYQIPMIDAGCGPRASTGEIFYYKPGCGMSCYTCAYGEDRGVDHSDQSVRREFYATETELEKLHFQPGMALDIDLTAIFETKLAIDLLMESEPGYEQKLLPYLKQCTILLNYPVEQSVNPYMQLFDGTPMQWKTGPVSLNPECRCQRKGPQEQR